MWTRTAWMAMEKQTAGGGGEQGVRKCEIVWVDSLSKLMTNVQRY